jgi:hypothetical protein
MSNLFIKAIIICEEKGVKHFNCSALTQEKLREAFNAAIS